MSTYIEKGERKKKSEIEENRIINQHLFNAFFMQCLKIYNLPRIRPEIGWLKMQRKLESLA